MKKILFLAYVLIFISFTNCSSVKVTYDKEAPFSQYKTFAYVKPQHKILLPVEYQKIIYHSIDRFIRDIPLRPDAHQPDILVRIEMDFHKRYDMYAPPVYPPPAMHGRRSYEGNIDIIFIDARSNREVWKARFPLIFSSRKDLMHQLEKRLRRLKESYPPIN